MLLLVRLWLVLLQICSSVSVPRVEKTSAVDVLLPPCQEATRRPRTSTVCSYPQRGKAANPANNTECTDSSLCESLSQPMPKSRCGPPSKLFNTTVSDGVAHRYVYITYPEGCAKPKEGWPFLLFFGFDINGVSGSGSLAAEILYMKNHVLAQGVAFVETSMYWNDTYDQRECNDFELGTDVRETGTCRTCITDADPVCRPLRNWFTCGNSKDARDIVMMRALFQNMQNKDLAWNLNVEAMAYLGWSVGGHMVSRMIQLGAEGSPFPTPVCGVMISGASYHCYSCPTVRKAGEPTDEFERCNWYAQGSVANDSIVTNASVWPCSAPFPPFNKLQQNKFGVCPGYTLYPDAQNWWQMEPSAQQADDPLLTEAAWDSCSKPFSEHPPVLVVQPWEDTDAYWNLASNYFEVLARQKGARGCRMFAGEKIHGPAPAGDLATLNFLLQHLIRGRSYEL